MYLTFHTEEFSIQEFYFLVWSIPIFVGDGTFVLYWDLFRSSLYLGGILFDFNLKSHILENYLQDCVLLLMMVVVSKIHLVEK